MPVGAASCIGIDSAIDAQIVPGSIYDGFLLICRAQEAAAQNRFAFVFFKTYTPFMAWAADVLTRWYVSHFTGWWWGNEAPLSVDSSCRCLSHVTQGLDPSVNRSSSCCFVSARSSYCTTENA